MARALRIDEAGLTFHVWANGVNSLAVFRDHDDRDFAVRLLRDEVAISEWTCLEYVVMTTHYHVLLRLRKATLSSGFKRFNVRYAQYFNRKYARRGHVFDARFQSKLVDDRFGQLELARYLARNPVKAKICERPEDYQWSGYGATVGLFADDGIVDPGAALAPLRGSRSAYRRYVEEPDARKRWTALFRRATTPTRTRAAAG